MNKMNIKSSVKFKIQITTVRNNGELNFVTL